jgi:hypothetical protein
MIRNVTMLSLILLLITVKFASADSYDDCTADCGKARNQCVEGITLYDQTGVQEAKQVCANELAVCGNKCHDMDEMGADGYQEMLKKQAEEAERKRQEQELSDNGNIKTYSFDK